MKKRDAWLADEMKTNAGKPDAFDDKVASILREQAKTKGITYESGEKK